jgi:hypothetical protein
MTSALHLFRAIGCRFLSISVKGALAGHRWVWQITGARTAPVLCDYVELWEKLEAVQLRPFESDRFVWRWSADGKYSASSAYRSFFVGMSSMLGAKELWKTPTLPKVKLFFWLALHGHIWTAERRWRHGLQDSAECALCSQEDETVDHLLLDCVFARDLWFSTLRSVGWARLTPQPGALLAAWWIDSRRLVPGAGRRGFDATVLLISWCLWKERNAHVFNGATSVVSQLAVEVKLEGDRWIGAGFSALSTFLLSVVA